MDIHATHGQSLAAFAALTPKELKILRLVGIRRIRKTSFSESEDLLREALHYLLTDRRKWPIHISFPAFLHMTMRSIAAKDRKKMENRAGLRISLEAMERMERREGTEEQPETWHPSAEDELLAKEEAAQAEAAIERIKAALACRPGALRIFGGILAGLRPAAMKAAFGMSDALFDRERKAVEREVRKGAAWVAAA